MSKRPFIRSLWEAVKTRRRLLVHGAHNLSGAGTFPLSDSIRVLGPMSVAGMCRHIAFHTPSGYPAHIE